MPISNEQLEEIKYDFRTGPDSNNFIIPQSESDGFWNWFRDNAEEFTSDNTVSTIYNNGYITGSCYGNSQSISVRYEMQYVEGFFVNENVFKMHGFNLNSENITDYTVHFNQDEFKDHNNNLPSSYIGIRIPSDFVRDNRPNIITLFANKEPLLLDYYRSTLE